MKKIYITDLDHTFLKMDLSISDYTKKIWNSYANSSIMSVATARTYNKAVQFLEGVEINAPMILLDGALIATRDKKVISIKSISKDVSDMIISEGAKLSIFPFVIALDGEGFNELFLHSHKLNFYQKKVLTRYAKDDNLFAMEHLQARKENFKLVYIGEEKLLKELKEALVNLFGDELKFILAPEIYTGSYFLTILHKNADKSHGIESMSEYLGLDLQKLTVFGDNFNDMGMFDLAGTSVAVANAQRELKDMATIVLEYTHEEDGVARYLEALR